MPKTLYICYFGIREALVQTQVLPYLRELRKGQWREGSEEVELKVAILTFEPDTSLDAAVIRTELSSEGIDWYWLPYHKRFSAVATAWDILRGTLFIRGFIVREKPDILHGRVHVPTLMGALARRLSRHKPKLLFDIRGFFPEEYTDAGVWPENGWMYRTAKRVERWLMKEADGFVVLTEKARKILFPETETTAVEPEAGHTNNGEYCKGYREKHGRPVEVIPCCVDLTRFALTSGEERAAMRRRLGVDGRRVIVYVGSFGGWYLTKEMLDFYSAAREHDPSAFAMILTQRDKENAVGKMREIGFAEGDFLVDSVSPDDLPQYLAGADIAVSFIKACYSKQSSSPTKIAEYLACGLPIIANRGVGDVDALIDGRGVGVMLDSLSRDAYFTALEGAEALGDVSGRCRETARREFALTSVGGLRYRSLYLRLLEKEN